MAEWKVINLPAIAEENDPLGREFGEAPGPRFTHSKSSNEPRSRSATSRSAPSTRDAPARAAPRSSARRTTTTPGRSISPDAGPASAQTRPRQRRPPPTTALRSPGASGTAVDKRKLYIREVLREQVQIPQFVNDLRALQARHDQCPAAVEGAGIGKAVVQTSRPSTRRFESPRARPLATSSSGRRASRRHGTTAAFSFRSRPTAKIRRRG